MPIACEAQPFAHCFQRAFLGCLALSLTLCLTLALQGCASLEASSATLLPAALVLLLVGVLSAALAGAVVRSRLQNQLLRCRQELRAAEQLQRGWTWRTGADHQLQLWQAPPQGPEVPCAWFDGEAHVALLTRLDTRQAFENLRLGMPGAAPGWRHWEVKGLPLHDAAGAFAGFRGTARATDAHDQRQLDADAWLVLLAAQPLPALMAWNSGDGLRIQHFNAAASSLWPTLVVGQPLAHVMVQTPEVAAQAAALAPGSAGLRIQGWQLSALPAQPLAMPKGSGVVLTQVALQDSDSAVNPRGEADTFSFTLSHDLRAPIRVVEGFTRIVKEDYGKVLDRVGNDHLDRVLGAATRMNLMIDALLTLARLSQQPLARQRVNLSQLAGFVAEDLRRSAPEREARIDIEPQLTAWGDPTLLRLVLENLLSNAWKYSGRCPQTLISVAKVQHGERSAFVVRDNGAGFDMRSADRLFGLFQRLHSASDFPGHGVGLASVQRIVRRHGGDIWAEGEPGLGAAFYFTLAA